MKTPNRKTDPCNFSCPKCGSYEVSRLFRPLDSLLTIYPKPTTESQFKVSIRGDSTYRVTVDHIQHTCRCCQFTWDTAPKSATKTKNKR